MLHYQYCNISGPYSVHSIGLISPEKNCSLICIVLLFFRSPRFNSSVHKRTCMQLYVEFWFCQLFLPSHSAHSNERGDFGAMEKWVGAARTIQIVLWCCPVTSRPFTRSFGLLCLTLPFTVPSGSSWSVRCGLFICNKILAQSSPPHVPHAMCTLHSCIINTRTKIACRWLYDVVKFNLNYKSTPIRDFRTVSKVFNAPVDLSAKWKVVRW